MCEDKAEPIALFLRDSHKRTRFVMRAGAVVDTANKAALMCRAQTFRAAVWSAVVDLARKLGAPHRKLKGRDSQRLAPRTGT